MLGKKNILIMTIGPFHKYPWYWDYIHEEKSQCDIQYKRISIENKRPQDITTLEFFLIILKVYRELKQKSYDYIFTFENDWITYSICLLQLFGIYRNLKHVILHFIMREKTDSLKSKLKYLILNILFKNTFRIVCSSRLEILYYKKVLNFPNSKYVFIPLSIEPDVTSKPEVNYTKYINQNFILSVGRTFRDYRTLIKAISRTNIKTIIVASPSKLLEANSSENICIKYDIALEEVTKLMKLSTIVVIPLQNINISIGQSVLLQSMAIGKPTIVTKVPGTIDYVTDGYNGIFVEPEDDQDLYRKIQQLMKHPELRKRIGENSKKYIAQKHHPKHYIRAIRKKIIFRSNV